MSKSYKEIMDKIYVDDAMKQRILQNIEKKQVEQETPQNIEKKQIEQETPQNIGKEQIEQETLQDIEKEKVEQQILQNIEKKQIEQETLQDIEKEKVEQRSLQNIEQEPTESFIDNNVKKSIFHYFHYKKISVYAAAILLIFCFTSYFGMSTILHTGRDNQHNIASDHKKDSLLANTKDTDSDQINSDTINQEDEADTGAESNTGTLSMEAGHGIDQYSSAKELSQKMGFTISDIPSSLIPFKISEKIYSDCGDGLAEIQYYSDKADNAIYHKQAVANTDVSGDYMEYSDITTIRVHSINICLKGEKGKYNLATWSKENYSYSLYFLNGITEKKFQNILEITI